LLVGIHFSLAMVTSTPELSMTAEEGDTLAKAYIDMQRHYASIVSGKTLDTMRFCMVAATMYGGRFVRINMRKKQEKIDAKARPNTTSTPATATTVRPAPVASATKPSGVNVAPVAPKANGHIRSPISNVPGEDPIFGMSRWSGQPDLSDTHE
jgi:hypothetical protein